MYQYLLHSSHLSWTILWCKDVHVCKRPKQDSTSPAGSLEINESKRQQLMGCQYLVRYQTMNIKEFKQCLHVSRLLTNSEVKHVTSSLMHKNYSLRYINKKNDNWKYCSFTFCSRNCQLFQENIARARIGKGTLHFPQLLKRKNMERKKLSIVQNIFLLISHVLD